MTLHKKLRLDQKGATAIEYGLIAALISVAAVGVIGSLGVNVVGVFTNSNTPVEAAATAN